MSLFLAATVVALGLAVVLVIVGLTNRGGATAPPRWPGLSWLALAGLAFCSVGLAVTGFFQPLAHGEMVHGWLLLTHTSLAGGFVVLLPLVALLWAETLGTRRCPSLRVRFGFWAVLVLGLVLTLTMLLSMLPWQGSAGLETLRLTHRWAAVLLLPAAGLLFAIRLDRR